MIKKILFGLIFLCLCIAVPLSIMGYTHVELGVPFMAFMKNISRELNDFKIEIPDIPRIPLLERQEASGVLEVLFNILNVLINFVNAISFVINILIQVFNIVIQLLQFVVLVIKNLIFFKDSLRESPLPVV